MEQMMNTNTGVPCNGCIKCCIGDAVRLLPEDDATLYHTTPHPYKPGALMLAHKPDGGCVYLDQEGCSIQGTKPLMCKRMDCRNIAIAISYTKARQLAKTGAIRMSIWWKGKELLNKGAA